MFLKCFIDVFLFSFFFNMHTSKITWRRKERWSRFGGGYGWGLIVTCHLIQLHFNLQRLEESHSANDSGMEAKVQQEGSRDFICWYLLTNHLDMNHSPPNGNPYSSSFPKALLWGCGWEAAFISSSYPLHHLCSLIKTPAYLKALHHPLTCIEFPVPHHWVYGPSLPLLMTLHRVTHMNMEISHRVHIRSYITELNWISTVFFDWWCHP